jgi:hypothetical protein
MTDDMGLLGRYGKIHITLASPKYMSLVVVERDLFSRFNLTLLPPSSRISVSSGTGLESLQ